MAIAAMATMPACRGSAIPRASFYSTTGWGSLSSLLRDKAAILIRRRRGRTASTHTHTHDHDYNTQLIRPGHRLTDENESEVKRDPAVE
jgi:hypothetical protein